VSFAIRCAARRAGTLLVALGLLGSLLTSPVQARHQDQAELSQVQGELDAIAKVLADARVDADQVARALVRADRDVAAARVALPGPSDATGRPKPGLSRRCGRRRLPSWKSMPSRH
jgi:septal ring factor EnvC (AmiA/AmiB activator)